MGPVGVPEMFAIFVIALILFGPKKLPELGRTLGKALSEFRRAKNELKGTFESHMRELERETQMLNSPSDSTRDHSFGYSHPYQDYNRYSSDLPAYSAPSRIERAEEPRPELPASTDSNASVEQQAVPGAVSRLNGARPLDEKTESVPEEQPSPAREEHPV